MNRLTLRETGDIRIVCKSKDIRAAIYAIAERVHGRRPEPFSIHPEVAERAALTKADAILSLERDSCSSSAAEQGARASTLPLGQDQHSAGKNLPWGAVRSRKFCGDAVLNVGGWYHCQCYPCPRLTKWSSIVLNSSVCPSCMVAKQRALLAKAERGQ